MGWLLRTCPVATRNRPTLMSGKPPVASRTTNRITRVWLECIKLGQDASEEHRDCKVSHLLKHLLTLIEFGSPWDTTVVQC